MRNGPTKIILIHAGKFDYAEVDLTGAIQVVGPNNIGKTTLINTLQFLYIPERRDMSFRYPLDRTFAYYFRDEHSYVLFECRTLRGTAVVGWRGNNKASGIGPERFYYLGPYNIEDFFHESGQIRNPRDVNGRLAQRGFRLTNKASEHREVLLAGASEKTVNLGIVSLNHSEKFDQFREGLKNLLTLKSITQEQMRKLLLMLADISPDAIAVDSRRVLGPNHELLIQDAKDLNLFKTREKEIINLVTRFNDRDKARGRLNYLYPKLTSRMEEFATSHQCTINSLGQRIALAQTKAVEANSLMEAKRAERDGLIETRTTLKNRLDLLAAQERKFSAFPAELEQAALVRIETQISEMHHRLKDAATETIEVVDEQLELLDTKITTGERTFQKFAQLVVTELRRQFSEVEIANIFGVLSPDLLELPFGRGGITLGNREGALSALRRISEHIHDGVYQDEQVTMPIRPAQHDLSKLASLEAVRGEIERLGRDSQRLENLRAAILDRDKVLGNVRDLEEQRHKATDLLTEYRQFQEGCASKAGWSAQQKTTGESLKALDAELVKLDECKENARKEQSDLRDERKELDRQYKEVRGRFQNCNRALFDAVPKIDDEIPEALESAISVYIHEQEREAGLDKDVGNSLTTLGSFVDRYQGASERATVRNLNQELDALPERERALTAAWSSHFQAIKSRFTQVLKDLQYVETARDSLNRDFAKVKVSDLKGLKLVIDRHSDEVALIERLAKMDELNFSGDLTPLNEIVEKVKQKLDTNPITRLVDLFTLGIAVTGSDGKINRYSDFHQIESDGTTVTVKVIFNLLILKSLLHKDDVAIPFYLDEVETLDPDNRRAVLENARQLGFIAITAAPAAISEVDTCYFLDPMPNGRVVLNSSHRLDIQAKPEPPAIKV